MAGRVDLWKAPDVVVDREAVVAAIHAVQFGETAPELIPEVGMRGSALNELEHQECRYIAGGRVHGDYVGHADGRRRLRKHTQTFGLRRKCLPGLSIAPLQEEDLTVCERQPARVCDATNADRLHASSWGTEFISDTLRQRCRQAHHASTGKSKCATSDPSNRSDVRSTIDRKRVVTE